MSSEKSGSGSSGSRKPSTRKPTGSVAGENDAPPPNDEGDRKVYTASITALLSQLIKAKCSNGPRKEFYVQPPDYSLPPPFRRSPGIRINPCPCPCQAECCSSDCYPCNCDCGCDCDPCCQQQQYLGTPARRPNWLADRCYTNPRCYPFPRPGKNQGCNGKSTSVYNNCSFYHCPMRCYYMGSNKTKLSTASKGVEKSLKSSSGLSGSSRNTRKTSVGSDSPI